MNQIPLTIVIPTTVKSKFLVNLLRSISLHAKNYCLQTIVVSNPVNRSLDSLGSQFIDIGLCVLQTENCGVNFARSMGLNAAINEYVLFLDDDCYFTNSDQIDFLYNEIMQNPDLFAVGGYYQADQQKMNVIARSYFRNQINWLKAGLTDRHQKKTAYLIGGYFILKKSVCIKNNLNFDQQMVFGGTEKEFFLQAHKKKLQLKLIDTAIHHSYLNEYVTYFIKIYKQGRGHRYIESKGLTYKPKYLLSSDSKYNKNNFIQILFNLFFWSGYYLYDNEYKKLTAFIFKNIANDINEKKIVFLNRIKKN